MKGMDLFSSDGYIKMSKPQVFDTWRRACKGFEYETQINGRRHLERFGQNVVSVKAWNTENSLMALLLSRAPGIACNYTFI